MAMAMTKPPAKDPRSRYTVENNMWDREDFDRILAARPDFSGKRKELVANAAGEAGYDFWADLYWLLWKTFPHVLEDEEIRDDRKINQLIGEEAQKLNEMNRLRRLVRGDAIGSAQACITLEPEIEGLYDRQNETQKLSEQLEELRKQMYQILDQATDIEKMIAQWEEEPGEGEEPDFTDQLSDLMQQQQELQELIDSTDAELQEKLDEMRPALRAMLRESLDNASDEAETVLGFASMWGDEPGDLQRMNPETRMKLAEKLNTEKMRRIAAVFGAIKRDAFTEQRRKAEHVPEFVHRIEMGDDLKHLLPTELMYFMDPNLRRLFLLNFATRALKVYGFKGHEKLAKGPIVYVCDTSGSMGIEKEVWAKAFGLALMAICRLQKREFYAISFSGPRAMIDFDFRSMDSTDAERVLDFASFSFGGGTDFMGPISHAVEILEEGKDRYKGVQGDIVFATDGWAAVTDAWREELAESKKRLGYKIWGIAIGGSRDGELLQSICDRRVADVHTWKNGHDVKSIFGEI